MRYASNVCFINSGRHAAGMHIPMLIVELLLKNNSIQNYREKLYEIIEILTAHSYMEGTAYQRHRFQYLPLPNWI